MTLSARLLRSVSLAATVCVLLYGEPLAESPYRLESSEEYLWLGGGAALLAGSFYAIKQIDPPTTEQLAALDPNQINGFDRRFMKPYRPDFDGDILAVASYILPFTLLAYDDTRSDFGDLSVMWLEVTLWNQALFFVTKATSRRHRPYAYDVHAPDPIKERRGTKLSFYSGHTASESANSFFTAKVVSDYTGNRGTEIAVWSAAAILPLFGGYYRVQSGHHFASDVIVGYAVGAAVGYLVPVFHRRDESPAPEPAAAQSANSSFTRALTGCAVGAAAYLLPSLHSRLSLEPATIDGAPGMVATIVF